MAAWSRARSFRPSQPAVSVAATMQGGRGDHIATVAADVDAAKQAHVDGALDLHSRARMAIVEVPSAASGLDGRGWRELAVLPFQLRQVRKAIVFRVDVHYPG